MIYRQTAELFFRLKISPFAFLSSCGSPPVDLRSLAPAETLVYLETNDLGKALGALTESRAFSEAAKRTPDGSGLV